jgi:hypothetical protein
MGWMLIALGAEREKMEEIMERAEQTLDRDRLSHG